MSEGFAAWLDSVCTWSSIYVFVKCVGFLVHEFGFARARAKRMPHQGGLREICDGRLVLLAVLVYGFIVRGFDSVRVVQLGGG